MTLLSLWQLEANAKSAKSHLGGQPEASPEMI